MIYCLSIHHTGTWTAIAWLNHHEDVKGFIQEAHIHDALNGKEVAHRVGTGVYQEAYHPFMAYHEHMRPQVFLPDGSPPTLPYPWEHFRVSATQMAILSICPTLIPIREPLAALVTYQKWGERDGRANSGLTELFSPGGEVDAWVALANTYKTIKRFGHARFLCWDLLRPGNVESTLLTTARLLGLKDREPSKEYASEQYVNNTRGQYPLKTAYIERDVETVRKGISDNGFDRLREREAVLRPFLEGLGYRNLLWWSE